MGYPQKTVEAYTSTHIFPDGNALRFSYHTHEIRKPKIRNALDIASGYYFIYLIYDFFSPRYFGFESPRYSGLCAP
jgi:hypothetical protein